MWNLIVSVPDHCLPVYFASYAFQGLESNLYKLGINHSQLDHIPDAVCNLTKLRPLSFTSCPNLQNISSSLFDHCHQSLNHVISLSLYNNQLDFPPNISAWFPNLHILNLSKNHLLQLPVDYSHPLKLRILDLRSYNSFTKIPATVLQTLPLLVRLHISGNKTTSNVQPDIQGIQTLEILELNENPVSYMYISPNAFTPNEF